MSTVLPKVETAKTSETLATILEPVQIERARNVFEPLSIKYAIAYPTLKPVQARDPLPIFSFSKSNPASTETQASTAPQKALQHFLSPWMHCSLEDEGNRLGNIQQHYASMARSLSTDPNIYAQAAKLFHRKQAMGQALKNASVAPPPKSQSANLKKCPIKTGEDSVFHILLGEWDQKAQAFVCTRVADRRIAAANKIFASKKGEALYALSKNALIFLIQDPKKKLKDKLSDLRLQYQDDQKDSLRLSRAAWDAFEQVLRSKKNIYALIESTTRIQNPDLMQQSLEEKFLAALYIPSFQEAIATLMPQDSDLKRLYQAYYQASSKSFDWDLALRKDPQLKMQYANYIVDSQNRLSELELHVLAVALDKTLEYYTVESPGVYELSKIYNATKGSVKLGFNPSEHPCYEKLITPTEYAALRAPIGSLFENIPIFQPPHSNQDFLAASLNIQKFSEQLQSPCIKSQARVRLARTTDENFEALKIVNPKSPLYLVIAYGTIEQPIEQKIPLYFHTDASNVYFNIEEIARDSAWRHAESYAVRNKANPGKLHHPTLLGNNKERGQSFTLHIPANDLNGINGIEKTALIINSNGDIEIVRVPFGVDLSIETPGCISAAADLSFQPCDIQARAFENRHEFFANTIDLHCMDSVTNSGSLFSEISTHINSDLWNKEGAIVDCNGTLVLRKGLSAIRNQGLMRGRILVQVSAACTFVNEVSGFVISNTLLDLNLFEGDKGGRFYNQGGFLAKALKLRGEVCDNGLSAVVQGETRCDLTFNALRNWGHIETIGAKSVLLFQASTFENSLEAVVHGADIVCLKIQVNTLNAGKIFAKKLIFQEIPLLKNTGEIRAQELLKFKKPALVQNEAGALMGSEMDSILLVLTGSYNHGEILSNILKITGPDFRNDLSGIIQGGTRCDLLIDALINYAHIQMFQDNSELVVKALTLINGAEAVIHGAYNLRFDLQIKAENLGALSGKNVLFSNIPVLQNRGTVVAELLLEFQTPCLLQNEEGAVLTCEGDLILRLLPGSYNHGTIIAKGRLIIVGADFEIGPKGIVQGGTDSDFTLKSLDNEGNIGSDTGDLNLNVYDIKHHGGWIASNRSVIIDAHNISISASIETTQDIRIYHRGGDLSYTDTLRALGELAFILSESRTLDQKLRIPGSLRYQILETATKPLLWRTDQSTELNFTIKSPFPFSLGEEAPIVLNALGGKINIEAPSITVRESIIFGGTGIALSSLKGGMQLGCPLDSSKKPSCLVSNGDIVLKATEEDVWDNLELRTPENLIVSGPCLNNIASEVTVGRNAFFDTPLNQHRLRIETKKLGDRRSHNGWAGNAHASFWVEHDQTVATTKPAHVLIGGNLQSNGIMKIFGSQVSCGSFAGNIPQIETFYPLLNYTSWVLCGHKDINHKNTKWFPGKGCLVGEPSQALFSVSDSLKSDSAIVDIRGVVSAIGVELKGIEHGNIGHRDLSFRLPAAKPFKSKISFLDYLKPTACFEITEQGGTTVFQPVFPMTPMNLEIAMDPVLILGPEGRFMQNVGGLRHLFTPIQEREILIQALMDNLGRNFLNPDLKDPDVMLSYLKHNTERYLVDSDSQALVAFEGLKAIPVPIFFNMIIPFLYSSKREESVLVPMLYLPPSLQNPETLDWAGGVFSFGGMQISGASRESSTLQMTAHMHAKGQFVISQFAFVSHKKRLVQETITVRNETTVDTLFSSKTTTTERQMVIDHVQAGATLQAESFVCEEVGVWQIQGLEVNVGPGGLRTKNLDQFDEIALVTRGIEQRYDTQGMLLGEISSVVHRPTLEIHYPARMHSQGGSIEITADHIYSDTLKSTNPEMKLMAVHSLQLGFIPRQLEEMRRIRDVEEAEARKAARRKQRKTDAQMAIGLALGTGVAIAFAPAVLSAISGTAAVGTGTAAVGAGTVGAGAGAVGAGAVLTSETLALAVTKGIMAGTISSAIRGGNVLEDGLKSAFTAAVGNVVGEALKLNNIGKGLKETEQAVFRGAVNTAASGVLSTALNGGNLLENIVCAAGAQLAADVAGFSFSSEGIGILSGEQLRTAISTTVSGATMALLKGGQFSDILTGGLAGGLQSVTEGVVKNATTSQKPKPSATPAQLSKPRPFGSLKQPSSTPVAHSSPAPITKSSSAQLSSAPLAQTSSASLAQPLFAEPLLHSPSSLSQASPLSNYSSLHQQPLKFGSEPILPPPCFAQSSAHFESLKAKAWAPLRSERSLLSAGTFGLGTEPSFAFANTRSPGFLSNSSARANPLFPGPGLQFMPVSALTQSAVVPRDILHRTLPKANSASASSKAPASVPSKKASIPSTPKAKTASSAPTAAGLSAAAASRAFGKHSDGIVQKAAEKAANNFMKPAPKPKSGTGTLENRSSGLLGEVALRAATLGMVGVAHAYSEADMIAAYFQERSASSEHSFLGQGASQSRFGTEPSFSALAPLQPLYSLQRSQNLGLRDLTLPSPFASSPFAPSRSENLAFPQAKPSAFSTPTSIFKLNEGASQGSIADAMKAQYLLEYAEGALGLSAVYHTAKNTAEGLVELAKIAHDIYLSSGAYSSNLGFINTSAETVALIPQDVRDAATERVEQKFNALLGTFGDLSGTWDSVLKGIEAKSDEGARRMVDGDCWGAGESYSFVLEAPLALSGGYGLLKGTTLAIGKGIAKGSFKAGEKLFTPLLKTSEKAAPALRAAPTLLEGLAAEQSMPELALVERNLAALEPAVQPEFGLAAWEDFQQASRVHPNTVEQLLSNNVKGNLGEAAFQPALQRYDYEFLECKLPGNKGFDHVAMKRGANGEISDIIVGESKYSSSGQAQLAYTKTKGQQMSPRWFRATLEEMRWSSDPKLVQTAELIRSNPDKIRLKGNILTPDGTNRWADLTGKIEKLHQ